MTTKNNSLEESISAAMDCDDVLLLKYLPYILQDFWEIGTSSDEIIKIIEKYKSDFSRVEVLDLGCGKGAVCVKIAERLKCRCLGIDAVDEFVMYAKNKANEYGVSNLCAFETGDIREKIKTVAKFDVIVLGAIGNVFGNYFETLSLLKPHLKKDGIVIIDDAYIDDDCAKSYANVLRKSELLRQISDSGLELVETITGDEMSGIDEEYEEQFSNLQTRCAELAKRYPEDEKLFFDYVEKQKREYEILTNEIIAAVFVIKNIK